jgi:mitochondrial protein import protein ZIM17
MARRYAQTAWNLVSRHLNQSATLCQDGFQRSPGEYMKGTSSGSVTKLAKMGIVFTCTKCESRVARIFTRRSYEKGVVIVRLEEKDGCKDPRGSCLHLIADNLGWFEDNPVNVETLLASRGEAVQRVIVSGKNAANISSLDTGADPSSSVPVIKTDDGSTVEFLIDDQPPAQ